MSTNGNRKFSGSTRRQLYGGGLVLVLLVGGIGGWSAIAKISGAVIAPGTVIVKSNKKRVQHAEGGIVRQINVDEGSSVKRGQVLFRLDGTRVRAELDIVRNRIFEALVKRDRLIAEREGRNEFKLMSHLKEFGRGADQIRAIVAVQRDLIVTRKEMRTNQKAQLRQRIAQYQREIEGLERQRKAKDEEAEILNGEIKNLTSLYEQGLSPVARLNALRRERSDVEYELGQILARIGQAGGRISEAEFKILETDERYRNDTLRQLEEVEGTWLELRQRRLALEDRLNRLDVVAPRSGRLHELKIHTVGAVISPGEVLAQVVPDTDELEIEARVRTIDIDNVRIGQAAHVRFTSFNMRTTPTIAATVVGLSPDQIVEDRTGNVYFRARIALDAKDRERLGSKVIVTGMPAEVFITTAQRTVISYLVQPLQDQIYRAFRED